MSSSLVRSQEVFLGKLVLEVLGLAETFGDVEMLVAVLGDGSYDLLRGGQASHLANWRKY